MGRYRKTYVFILLVVAVMLSVGCQNPFAPPEHKPPDNEEDVSIKDPDTPENVINNLKYAMNNRDVEEYENCLDEDYWYYSPPVLPDDPDSYLGFGRDDDVRIVRRILGQDPGFDRPGFKIIQFTFDHGDPDIEFGEEYPDEHPSEDWVRYEGTMTMYLYSDESKEYGHYINQNVIYRLRKDSENNWAIVRWEDVIPQ